ncbi:hypothetical protein AXF42_Ash004457 [Apostasia shenzhenica]|uniref:Exonuclease domain-containing protein n=1 Tax=Apostasia shenzhenica TaxID=1088818 RepID=A0A2I0BGN9_9ASPA|nr:hypothetical protein AXF42_Ash004457 [Apostasia shenzhenica]
MGEIAFFDVETTTTAATGRRFWLVEFGAIVVCPRKLLELESFCTLIRPPDLSAVTPTRLSGITRKAVAGAPTFEEVADQVFQILNDGDVSFVFRAWTAEAQPSCRSLDDVKMNLEVFKHCATVLLLESSLPHILPGRSHGSLSMVTRSRANNGRPCDGEGKGGSGRSRGWFKVYHWPPPPFSLAAETAHSSVGCSDFFSSVVTERNTNAATLANRILLPPCCGGVSDQRRPLSLPSTGIVVFCLFNHAEDPNGRHGGWRRRADFLSELNREEMLDYQITVMHC